MQTTTRVDVIESGVVGCPVILHPIRPGRQDVMPPLRSELTSGLRWRAAGGFHTRSGDNSRASLHEDTIKLDREPEAIMGKPCRATRVTRSLRGRDTVAMGQ